jgi:hypothetical protein
MNFTKLIYSVAITWLLVFSVRLVAINTPLIIYEKIGLVGIFIDYTLFRSRKL